MNQESTNINQSRINFIYHTSTQNPISKQTTINLSALLDYHKLDNTVDKFCKNLKQVWKFLNSQQNIELITLQKNDKDNRNKFIQQKEIEIEDKYLNKINQYFRQVKTNIFQISTNLRQIQQFITNFFDRYTFINSYAHKQQNMKQIKTILLVFNFLQNNFFVENFNQLSKQKSCKQMAIFILDLETKISFIPTYIETLKEFESDITMEQIYSHKYKDVWDNMVYAQMDEERSKIEDEIDSLKKIMKITTSSVVTERSSVENVYLQKIVFGLSFVRFAIASEEAHLRCFSIWRNPKVHQLKNIWNLPENGAIKELKGIIFPRIKNSFYFYIRRGKDPERKLVTNNNNKHNNTVTTGNISDQTYNIFDQPANHPQNSVKILVLCSSKITFSKNFKKYQPCTCCSCISPDIEEDFETIVVYIHGGGFIALSCDTVQTYTRKWANGLNVPIFCIDYRKPPEYRYPTAPYDCLQAYLFIVEEIHKYMNVRPKNIVLAGDSAGGNLACSLQALLMQMNYPILPKGILLAYPASDLRKRFSPSRLNSLNDSILLPPLLNLCLQEYLGGNNDNQQDPIASPYLLNKHFIKNCSIFEYQKGRKEQIEKWPQNWPRTTIMVGKKDPLYDDSIRLHEKLVRNKVESKLILYKQFSHAFLSLDSAIPQCEIAIQDSISQLRKLLFDQST